MKLLRLGWQPRRAAQLHLASFQLAAIPAGESFVIELDSGGLETRGIGASAKATSVAAWLSTYWWARATRNGTALDTLAAVDPAALGRAGGYDPALLALVTIIQARDAGDESWPQLVSAALSLVAQPTTVTREEAQMLHLDLFGVLTAIGDQDAFTNQLETALTSHRTYWTATDERRADPRGFSSLPLLGLAALAADENMRIEVESGYLPKSLIDNPPWMFELAGG